ncbi:MAG: transglutaminase-like cysteine peptidase [Sulfurimonas sp.]|nr:transglutaminase-like cysteine peptidase [Sulfurimonas sp.]
MKKIFYLTFIPLFLFASEYPYFTKKEFINIEEKSGKIPRNRAMDYQKNIAIFKTYNKTKQLNRTNHYLNQLLPQYDDIIQKQEDYWATPKEFLITGYGDCEDYVIIKYFTLLKLGFDKKKLFLTTVFEQYQGGYHMVLSYFKDKNKPPLILDNLSFRVLDLKTREDIKADIFINSTGIFKIDKNYNLKKIAHQSKQYNELMKKIRKNR